MTRARIQTRVWLSIGIFVLGFLLTTIVSLVERKSAERRLADIAEAVLPAAQAGREAEGAFRRVMTAYSEVFVMEARSGLDRAAAEGSRALESLERIGATREASAEYTAMARRVAVTLRQFLEEANATYGSTLPASARLSPESRLRYSQLAERATALKADLESLASGLSSDLQRRMGRLQSRSATMRVFMPSIFIATLVLAVTLVNVTLRRSVLAPLASVQNELAHGDLNQVFLNLLVNAAHAIGTVMKDTGVKGRIRVTTRADGDQVTVSISDTGCGIPAAIRSRVFDPFFTTKEVGRGTGQGLALARTIVEKHGGRITFEPNPPQGTTFVVTVPAGVAGTPAAEAVAAIATGL